MANKERLAAFAQAAKSKLNEAKQDILSEPALETALILAPISGRLLNVAYIPAYYYLTSLSQRAADLHWQWLSLGMIGLSMGAISLTEIIAIKRKRYCSNMNTNIIKFLFENPGYGVIGGRLLGLGSMFSPANPVELGMVTYLGLTGDLTGFTKVMAARYMTNAIYHCGVDLLLATGKLDPVFHAVRLGKQGIQAFFAKRSYR